MVVAVGGSGVSVDTGVLVGTEVAVGGSGVLVGTGVGVLTVPPQPAIKSEISSNAKAIE